MKKIKFFTVMSVLFLFSSCSLTLDVDDQDELGSISATVIGDNSDGSVSLGGYLELEISAFDRDGIASIRIEIPSINVDFLTNINSDASTQKISQAFNVNEIDSSASKTIFVTLTDKDSNRYTKTIAFATD